MKKTASKSTKAIIKNMVLFAVGAFGYYTLEVIYRGFSHPSMAVCGGICLIGIYTINRKMPNARLLPKALLCSLFITAVEFLAGCIINLWLGWNVWSYAALKFNLLGQVSLLFTFIWFLLSLIICALIGFMSRIKRRLYYKKKTEQIAPF